MINVSLTGNLLEHILNPENKKEFVKMFFHIPASELDSNELPKMVSTIAQVLEMFECSKTKVHFSFDKGIAIEDFLQDDKSIIHEDHFCGKALRQIMKKLNTDMVVSSPKWGNKCATINDSLQIIDIDEIID